MQETEHNMIEISFATGFEKMPNKAPAKAGVNNTSRYASTYSENTTGLPIRYIENI